MRRLALLSCAFALLAAGTAGAQASAQPSAASWATPQIKTVVAAGLMAPSIAEFRPDDALTSTELATVLASLGVEVAVTEPDKLVSIRELDALLVTAVGLRPEAREIRLEAERAGLAPKPWLGTETVARLLGLRVNHLTGNDARELQLAQPATRAEAAYSLARILSLEQWEYDQALQAASSFDLPELDPWQQTILTRAVRFVGSPYVFAGTSERTQNVLGRKLPGGFDCSGFVWRVYKLEPFEGAPALSAVLKGRTSYAMSGEVARAARIPRATLQPGDLVFFGDRGPQSKPTEVGHMCIYVGNGWMVHSSSRGTTLVPMTGWYATRFAWGRRPLAEAGIS
jgi:cell wall-associated NlpC family hydrolase